MHTAQPPRPPEQSTTPVPKDTPPKSASPDADRPVPIRFSDWAAI